MFDYESNGAHRLLGEAESSALKLQKLAGGGTARAQAVQGGRECGVDEEQHLHLAVSEAAAVCDRRGTAELWVDWGG